MPKISTVTPPTITDQPDPQLLVVPGQSATFTVVATGDNLMYQWQKGGSDIAIGATSATYTIAAVAESDTGKYQCVVFNIASITISIVASLTVCKCASARVLWDVLRDLVTAMIISLRNVSSPRNNIATL